MKARWNTDLLKQSQHRIMKLRRELAAQALRDNQIATAPPEQTGLRVLRENQLKTLDEQTVNEPSSCRRREFPSPRANQSAPSLGALKDRARTPHSKDNVCRTGTQTLNQTR
jgi:hypothetical protein